ncbi:MAG: hypothetical protein AAF612_10365 [Planctomycetota bacterium]
MPPHAPDEPAPATVTVPPGGAESPGSPGSPKAQAIAKDRHHRRLVDTGTLARLTRGQRAVLDVYLRHMGRDWTAYPGATRLAQLAGLSLGRAKAARATLIRLGLLEPLGKVPSLTVHRYRVVQDFTPPPPEVAPEAALEAVPHADNGRAHVPPTGAPACPQRARPRTLNGRARAPQKTSQENTTGTSSGPNPSTTTTATANPATPPEPAAWARELRRELPGGELPGGGQPGLFDRDDAVGLLVATGQWDRTPKRLADAARLVAECGPENVRRAIDHAAYLKRNGRLRGTFRGCIVHAARGYARGTWAEDEGMARQRQRDERAAAARQHHADRQRRQRDDEARRQRLAEADDLLWSQLSPAQRDDLHRAVLATLTPRHPMRDLPPDGRNWRAAILMEHKKRLSA